MLDYQLLFLITGYAFIGGGLKYIDQAYDENAFPKSHAKILSAFVALTMAYVMATDTPFSTSYLGAMILGVVIAKKIDNLPFTVVVLGTISILYLLSPTHQFYLDPTLFISFLMASFLDEIVDKEAPKRIYNKYLRTILQLRPLNDITLITLITFGFVNWIYLIPFYAFFIAYYAVEKVSEKRPNNV